MISGNFFVDFFLLCTIGLAVGLWWTGTRAKELAIAHAKQLCSRESVQLLDYTVALKKTRLSRSSTGATCLRRDYTFDFTAHGQHRDQGSVSLKGHQLAHSYLPYTRDEEGNRVFVN